jgi:hypothetical protein
VVTYTNDHSPEHVHVIGPGCEAVLELRCPHGPVSLRETYGFAKRRLQWVIDQLERMLFELCTAWENIHGTV